MSQPRRFRALWAAALLWAAAPARPQPSEGTGPEPLAILLDGEVRDRVEAYRKGDELYVSLRDLVRVYGGRAQWHAVSGRVVWRLNGQALELQSDSDRARVGGREAVMKTAMIDRADRSYVPVEFLSSDEFSGFTEMSTEYRAEEKALYLSRTGTVGTPRVYSYNDRTRVEIELSPGARYLPRRVGSDLCEIQFPDGRLKRDETREVEDGRVRSIEAEQAGRQAVVRIRLESAANRWGVGVEEDPHRLLVDVLGPELAGGLPVPVDSVPEISSAAPMVVVTASTQAATPPAPAPSASTAPVAVAAPAGPTPAKAAPHAISPGHAAVVPKAAAPVAVVSLPARPVSAPEAAPPLPPPPRLPPGRTRPLIVIDPGHGGKDSGAVGPGPVFEKDVNLQVAKLLAGVLKREGRFQVFLTRTKDVFVPLRERSRMANARHADLFISVHCNAAPNKRLKGFEVFFLSEEASDPWAAHVAAFENSVLALEDKPSKEDPATSVLHDMERTEFINESSTLSGLVSRRMNAGRSTKSLGAKQAGFYVLRGTMSPAVLLEVGFLTNTSDRDKITSPSFQARMVEGIYGGILDYAKLKNWAF